MKYIFWVIALALFISSLALSAEQSLITCWYNEKGVYTGADTAEPGTKPGGPVRKDESGDYTWAYTIEAKDGTSCPRSLPSTPKK